MLFCAARDRPPSIATAPRRAATKRPSGCCHRTPHSVAAASTSATLRLNSTTQSSCPGSAGSGGPSGGFMSTARPPPSSRDRSSRACVSSADDTTRRRHGQPFFRERSEEVGHLHSPPAYLVGGKKERRGPRGPRHGVSPEGRHFRGGRLAAGAGAGGNRGLVGLPVLAGDVGVG